MHDRSSVMTEVYPIHFLNLKKLHITEKFLQNKEKNYNTVPFKFSTSHKSTLASFKEKCMHSLFCSSRIFYLHFITSELSHCQQ